jgi:hypothetical protein
MDVIFHLTAVSVNMTTIWNDSPCVFVEVDRRFRGTYYLDHQGDNVLDDGDRNSETLAYLQNTRLTARHNIPGGCYIR